MVYLIKCNFQTELIKTHYLRVWFRLTGLASSEKKQYEKGMQKIICTVDSIGISIFVVIFGDFDKYEMIQSESETYCADI